MSPETRSLVQRWIDTFGEPPVLIDEALMRGLLDETMSRDEVQAGSKGLSPIDTHCHARLRDTR
ncbi:hypothetical protein [uncultured Brevundimonas sp.]|uniref:hypothetical protein n=1 Tax=uncultured Brevundimonas sp. TaxID=213418 RepID=UPI0030EF8E05|tara:strand:+ start:126401 stop:126592 length:192 start_codon:yes stop_codon:yes gene_type:complete